MRFVAPKKPFLRRLRCSREVQQNAAAPIYSGGQRPLGETLQCVLSVGEGSGAEGVARWERCGGGERREVRATSIIPGGRIFQSAEDIFWPRGTGGRGLLVGGGLQTRATTVVQT